MYHEKWKFEELESLLGPDDSDVNSKRILEEALDERGCAIFKTFSSDGPSEFLVVSRTRWDQPWRQNLSSSSSGRLVASGLGRAAGYVEHVAKKER